MKGHFYEALTDDPMVDVLAEQDSIREVPVRLIRTMNLGHAAMSGSVNDPVLKPIRHGWYLAIRMEEDGVPDDPMREQHEISQATPNDFHTKPTTGKFPMHEGGR